MLKTTSIKKQNLTVPIILGLGIALIVLTVIVVLARVYCHSRAKTAFDLSCEFLLHCDWCNNHAVTLEASVGRASGAPTEEETVRSLTVGSFRRSLNLINYTRQSNFRRILTRCDKMDQITVWSR